MSDPAVTAPLPPHLIDFLPAIYADGDSPDHPSFLAQFLRAFEAVLFGASATPAADAKTSGQAVRAAPVRGLEEEILALPSLLDPMRTPADFLPWLAGWAALTFHPDLSETRRRKLLAAIIPLYRIRGTRRYIEELLTLTTGSFVAVTDAEIPGLQVGTHATVGLDTYLGGGPPHFFAVRVIAPNLNDEERTLQTSIARSILELARPAHTSYHLSLVSPRLRVGIHSTIGLDTVIGPVA